MKSAWASRTNKFLSESNLYTLDHVYRWLCLNKIVINAGKTKYVIFSYRDKIAIPPIKFGNDTLLQTSNCKFLGLYLDESLRFENHVNHIARKISKSMGILNKVKKIFPSEILLTLYFSLIHPYIMYALEFWYSAPTRISNIISVLQKKSIRICYDLPYNAHTFNYFIRSGLLRLPYLYERSILIYMFKSINFNHDCYFSSLLVRNADVHSLNTRNGNDYVLPLYNRSITQRCILYRAIKLWNGLPVQLKQLGSISVFKKKITEVYLNL